MMCVLKANSDIARAQSFRIAVRFALKILYFLHFDTTFSSDQSSYQICVRRCMENWQYVMCSYTSTSSTYLFQNGLFFVRKCRNSQVANVPAEAIPTNAIWERFSRILS